MPPTERRVNINGYEWMEVPRNSTQPGFVYDREHVERCGGDPAKVIGPIQSSRQSEASDE